MRVNGKNGITEQQYKLYKSLRHGWNGEVVNMTDARMWLNKAAAAGHSDAVRVLGTLNETSNTASNGNGGDHASDTPLIHATRVGDVTKITTIIRTSPVQVNQCNSMGVSPLCIASAHGYTAIARLLLSAKANVNHETKARDSALSLAGKDIQYPIVCLHPLMK
jgi:ankyrin repeat protein